MRSLAVSAERGGTGRATGFARPAAAWPEPLDLLVRLLSATPASARPLRDGGSWDAFVTLVVERHRVAPAVLRGLRLAAIVPPSAVLERIEAAARTDGLAALAQKAETRRLAGALEARGCVPMLLKGWPLAEDAYGSAAERHSKDIDLYIAETDLASCLEVLAELGYEVQDEHRDRMRLVGRPVLTDECNDIAFEDRRGMQVEIHWRSNHFRGWPDLREMGGAPRLWPVDAGGVSIRVPSEAANLVYLALHGQQHAWSRLKWLLDVAVILRRRCGAPMGDALAVARRLGASRALVSAVHLAHRVFGDPLPDGWPADGMLARRMQRRFLAGMAQDSAAPGALRGRFDFYLVGLVMAEGLSQRLGVLRYAFWRPARLFWCGRGA